MQNIDPENAGRSLGFLTQKTREYVLPNKETSDPEDMRNQVKKRTRHALADLMLLQRYADEDLKRELIRSRNDMPIFTGVETRQLHRTGVFLLESIIDEDSAEMIDEVMRSDELRESFDAALSDDLAGTMGGIVGQIKRLPITKKEAHAAIEQYW